MVTMTWKIGIKEHDIRGDYDIMEQTGWIQLSITIIGLLITALGISSRIGTFNGVVTTKIEYLEKKMDRHNQLIERMYVVEESAKVAHHRIDECNRIKEK